MFYIYRSRLSAFESLIFRLRGHRLNQRHEAPPSNEAKCLRWLSVMCNIWADWTKRMFGSGGREAELRLMLRVDSPLRRKYEGNGRICPGFVFLSQRKWGDYGKTDHLYVSPRRPTADWSLFMCSVAARSVDWSFRGNQDEQPAENSPRQRPRPVSEGETTSSQVRSDCRFTAGPLAQACSRPWRKQGEGLM